MRTRWGGGAEKQSDSMQGKWLVCYFISLDQVEYFSGDGTSIELGGTWLSWICEICWTDISGNINKTGYCKIVGCLEHQMAEGESNNKCCWAIWAKDWPCRVIILGKWKVLVLVFEESLLLGARHVGKTPWDYSSFLHDKACFIRILFLSPPLIPSFNWLKEWNVLLNSNTK